MEKLNLLKKRSPIQNVLLDEYSYLNNKRLSKDKINCLSLDLNRLAKKNNMPPSLTKREDIINGIAEKLKRLKKKLKQNQQRQYHNFQKMKAPNIDINSLRMPTPFPISYPYQQPYPPFPYYSPLSNGCCPQCSNKPDNCHNHNKTGKKKNRKKENKKTKQQMNTKTQKLKKIKKTNKFRIYAYAVYFCIFIKSYSKRFTQNRRNWFMDRYGKKDGGIIYVASQAILKKLQQIDLYKLSEDAKSNYNSNWQTSKTIDWVQYTNTALVPGNQTFKPPINKQSSSQFIINFVQLLFTKINQIFLDNQFISEYHEVFSAGSLDLNFLINNLYLPQEIPFLFIHPTKGYLRLNYQQQIQLLMIKIMVKVIIYNYLLGLDKSKSWNKKIQNANSLSHDKLQQLWEIIRTVSIYLYIVCKQMYLQGIKNISHVSNFNQISHRFGIKKAKTLQQGPQFEIQQKKQNKFQLIRNITNLTQFQQKLGKNIRLNQYKEVVKQKIIDLITDVYSKIKKQERDFYMYIKNMTLSTPYLIFESLKQKQQIKQNRQKYKILKPSKDGKAWNKIYADSQHSNDKSKPSVKFDQSSLNKTGRKTFDPAQVNKSTMKKTITVQGKQNYGSFSKNKSFGLEQNQSTIKKIQTSAKYSNGQNLRYGSDRQDRLFLKFKHFLNK